MPEHTDYLYPREVCAMLNIKPCSLGQLVTRGLIERAPRDTWYADGCPTYCRASVEARRDEMASRAHATVSAARAAQVAARRGEKSLSPSGEGTPHKTGEQPMITRGDTLQEATVIPSSGGFGHWQVQETVEVDWCGGDTLDDWRQYMDREYDWRWADEIDGLIEGQDGGKAFAWRPADSDDDWTYGVVWGEEVKNE